MRFSHRTQGATLIVSLLFVMLILAVIMAVTAQVTLSTRRSSADQQRVLAARYAAESGVAQVQARLRTMKALLDSSSIPPSVGNSVVDARIRDLCGVTVLPAATRAGTTVCTFPSQGLSGNVAQVGLFDLAVGATDFARQGFRNTATSDRETYWMNMFSGTAQRDYTGSSQDGSTYHATFGLVPTELRRYPEGYRLTFTVPSVTAQGITPLATQRVRARATTDGSDVTYYLRIGRGSFAKYALFTNHHFQSADAEDRGDRINFTARTLFSGPVHTNQHFLFEGNASGQPVFWGPVTSAGCPDGDIGAVTATDGSTGDGCTVAAQPGAYFDASAEAFVGVGAMTPSVDAPVSGDNAPQFNSTVQWDADFVPLPSNNQNQNLAARQGGLLLSGDVTELRLSRALIGGVERQRITYTQGGKTVELSYGQDGLLWLLDTSGTWVSAARDSEGVITASSPQASFNGVISVQGGSIQNLNGGPNAAQPIPAGASIASFAGITVAASGDVNVTSSLTYTDPPCSGENTTTAPAPCDALNATNILGVYSSAGNVNLVSPRGCPGGDGTCPSLSENPEIDAILMASQGAVQVQGFDQGTPLGSVKLLGGVIENYYGAFGQFDASGPTHGYGRNFVYDQRTADGYAPPAFPTQQNWTIGLYTAQPDGSEKKMGPDDGRGIRLQGDSVSIGEGGS
ncbi:DUF4900 domain-containing protein [Deinococcus sp. KSM4-11]|uniref:DUF4900 domain-containing protein n=1 Tax=Deinococcus sp. KSM4-11 TaxID=2568654 RepID=UPI0010A2C4E6|nr:DUF4900 domain-containing protein [Deinococcus sp. KSM4-11]THF86110.1 DUF4900 domain-containing protein [Deinococcus sp. KSM4-11]